MTKQHESKSEREAKYRQSQGEGDEKPARRKAIIILDCSLDIHNEVQRGLCNGWAGYGRNLDALADVLRGGFGVDLEASTIVLLKHKELSTRELYIFQDAQARLRRDIVFQ